MPSESIPEDERLALARALRHVSEEDTPERTPENQEEIARLFGDDAEAEAEAAPAEPTKEEGEGRPRFRLLHILIGLLVLACLALVVPLALDFLGGDDSGEVPVIQAEQQPDKVRPEEPGGLQVPHQDLQVLNQDAEEGATEPVERLLPPPETPEPLAQATEDVFNPGVVPGEAAGAAPTEAPASPAAEDTTAATVAPGAGDLPGPGTTAPAEVAEVPAAPPAESTGGPDASQAAEAPAAPAATTPAPAAPAPEAAAPVEAATPEPKAVEPPSPAKPKAPAESQQAALPPAAEAAPAAAAGGIYIQLGSLTNRDGVPKEWARLQKAFPDFLGDMELAVQTVTLEGRGTFHRIQAGPLPNRGTAEEMCAFLKGAKQACIVIKR